MGPEAKYDCFMRFLRFALPYDWFYDCFMTVFTEFSARLTEFSARLAEN